MIALVLAAVITLPASFTHVDVPNPPGSTVEVLELGRGPVVDHFTTTINVIRRQYTDDTMTIADWAASAMNDLQTHDGVKIVTSRALKVCNHDAWWVESTGPYNGRNLDLVQEALLDGGYEYVATYSRPQGSAEDADVIKALATLCPM